MRMCEYFSNLCVPLLVGMYIYIYIYIWERERERPTDINIIYVCVFVYSNIFTFYEWIQPLHMSRTRISCAALIYLPNYLEKTLLYMHKGIFLSSLYLITQPYICIYIYIYIYIKRERERERERENGRGKMNIFAYINIRGAFNKFPDLFCKGI